MILAALLAFLGFIEETVPVFRGYEAPRFQKHDRLILELVKDFNRNRLVWVGGCDGQLEELRPLTPAEVKAHMIQESGSSDARSRAAWEIDPLQVNVPGDWSPYKKYLGLRKPRRRNEGTLRQNLKAGIQWLARKGFGSSAAPAANRPEARFDGWHAARERYNGRMVHTSEAVPYCRAYANRIESRARYPDTHIPIPIKSRKK